MLKFGNICRLCDDADIILRMSLINHLHTIAVHSSDINSLAFNNELLASGSGDKTVRLWNLDEDFIERPFSPLNQGHTYRYTIPS